MSANARYQQEQARAEAAEARVAELEREKESYKQEIARLWPHANQAEARLQQATEGLRRATDLLLETINGYKIDQAAAWLSANGFMADDEPPADSLAALVR